MSSLSLPVSLPIPHHKCHLLHCAFSINNTLSQDLSLFFVSISPNVIYHMLAYLPYQMNKAFSQDHRCHFYNGCYRLLPQPPFHPFHYEEAMKFGWDRPNSCFPGPSLPGLTHNGWYSLCLATTELGSGMGA